MGDPKKTSKHFDRPLRLWDKENLEKERILKSTYGLKNKRELWRQQTMLSKKRKTARQLLAMQLEQRAKKEKELLDSLARLGLANENAGLDDVLTLSVESVLERRLQTVVWRKGLANSPKQARQFIVHGHIAVKGKKVSAPSYLVPAGEEEKISYYGEKMQLAPPVKKEKKKPTPEEEAESAEGAESEAEEADESAEGIESEGIEAEEEADEGEAKEAAEAEEAAEKEAGEKDIGKTRGEEKTEGAGEKPAATSEAAGETGKEAGQAAEKETASEGAKEGAA